MAYRVCHHFKISPSSISPQPKGVLLDPHGSVAPIHRKAFEAFSDPPLVVTPGMGVGSPGATCRGLVKELDHQEPFGQRLNSR